MEVFDRTFLPAAAEAGLTPSAIARHLALYRRCLGSTEPVLLVSRCLRPDRPWAGEHLLAMTRTRLVVTQESHVLRRIRLHLDAPVTELGDAWWRADPRQVTTELAVTAADGIRERFQLRARHPKALWHLDALFGYVFRAAVNAAPIPIPNVARAHH